MAREREEETQRAIEASAEVQPLRPDRGEAFTGHLVGQIVRVDVDGRAYVVFPGGHGVPVLARSTIDAPRRGGERLADLEGAEVLLVFEGGDPGRPIILGLVREAVRPEPVREELSLDLSATKDVVVDGERIVLDAHREVVLRCGRSTIVLTRDGRVLIRGTDLVSRSSGKNRIKGASISLN